jgi:hypothetical protein
LKFFEIEQSKISVKDILEAISSDIPLNFANTLKKCKSWKEALLRACILDEEFNDLQVRNKINRYK